MKHVITIQGQEQEVALSQTGESVTVERGGHKKTFRFKKTSAGYILEKDGQIFHTNLQNRVGELHTVNVNQKTIQVTLPNPYAIQSSGASSGQAGEVRAVMPGRVIKIHVKADQEVKTKDPILVLEAMKMENEIKATMDGRIAEILVKEGSSVDAGTLLVKIQ